MLVIYIFLQAFVMPEDYISSNDKGKKLANVYCGACHKVPMPYELDKKTWSQYILPRMKKMMGLDSISADDGFFENVYLKEIKDRGTFMDFSALPNSSWEDIENYYLSEAPENLYSADNKVDIQMTSLFTTEYPSIYTSPPSTSLVRIASGQIWWGDIHTKTMHVLDGNYDVIKSLKIPVEGLVDMQEFGDGKIMVCMGSFSPTDDTTGLIYYLDIKNSYKLSPLISGLRRPVHTQVKDINNDGMEDVIVSEYGKWLGQL